MPVAAIGVDDNRRGAGKGGGVLRPAVRMHLGAESGDLVQGGLEQRTAGPMGMRAGAVAVRAGNKHDFPRGAVETLDPDIFDWTVMGGPTWI